MPSGWNVTGWNWWLDIRASLRKSAMVNWLVFNVGPCVFRGNSNCELYSHLFKGRRKESESALLLSLFISYFAISGSQVNVHQSLLSSSTDTFHICVLLPGERVGPGWTSEAVLLVVIQPLLSSAPPPSLHQPSTTHLACCFIPLRPFCSLPFELFKSGLESSSIPDFLKEKVDKTMSASELPGKERSLREGDECGESFPWTAFQLIWLSNVTLTLKTT